KAEQLAQRADDPYGIAYAWTVRAIAHSHRGEWRRALELLAPSEVKFNELLGTSFELANTTIFKCLSLYFLGELPALRDAVLDQIADADRRGDEFHGTNMRVGFFNCIWLADDEPMRARSEASAAIAKWPSDVYLSQHCYHLCAQTQIDLYLGGRLAWERVD